MTGTLCHTSATGAIVTLIRSVWEDAGTVEVEFRVAERLGTSREEDFTAVTFSVAGGGIALEGSSNAAVLATRYTVDLALLRLTDS